MKAAIYKIANFLSVNISENEVISLAEFVDIKNFKRNSAVNFEKLREVGIWNKEEESFIRQGKFIYKFYVLIFDDVKNNYPFNRDNKRRRK